MVWIFLLSNAQNSSMWFTEHLHCRSTSRCVCVCAVFLPSIFQLISNKIKKGSQTISTNPVAAEQFFLRGFVFFVFFFFFFFFAFVFVVFLTAKKKDILSWKKFWKRLRWILG